MTRQQKRFEKKWGPWLALGLVALLGLGFLAKTAFGGAGRGEEELALPMSLTQVEQGNLASSSLLTGTVKVIDEEKIYFDSSRGSHIAEVYVNVGDYVFQGQPLMKYATGTAQTNYDQAVRALNKVNRQIVDLQATGVVTAGADGTTTDWATAQRTYDNQLMDLYDAHATAKIEVDKAALALTQTLEVSAVTGRVVEINTAIDPAKTGGQLVMHVVSEGQLKVEGSLSEFDVSTVTVGQKVQLTSKVFPDKTWEGRVSYVSNYPGEAGSTGGSGNSSASYPFRVDFKGEPDGLKQGFKMNMEVLKTGEQNLLPVTALVFDGEDAYVWVYQEQTKTVKKTPVTLGQADAFRQEILSGLTGKEKVVDNPSADLKDGQELSDKDLVSLGGGAGD